MIDRTENANKVEINWKDSTSAPNLKLNFDPNMKRDQKTDNIITLKNGPVVIDLIGSLLVFKIAIIEEEPRSISELNKYYQDRGAAHIKQGESFQMGQPLRRCAVARQQIHQLTSCVAVLCSRLAQ